MISEHIYYTSANPDKSVDRGALPPKQEKEIMNLLDYLLENDTREPKSDSYAYNKLHDAFKPSKVITDYLNKKID